MTRKVEEPAVEAVPLHQLHPAPWNPRTIKDERFQNLVRSIQADPDFLWRRPILATADGTIYAGNMRYRAAQHLGMATSFASCSGMSSMTAGTRRFVVDTLAVQMSGAYATPPPGASRRLTSAARELVIKRCAHVEALFGPTPQTRWGVASGLDLLYGSILPEV